MQKSVSTAQQNKADCAFSFQSTPQSCIAGLDWCGFRAYSVSLDGWAALLEVQLPSSRPALRLPHLLIDIYNLFAHTRQSFIFVELDLEGARKAA